MRGTFSRYPLTSSQSRVYLRTGTTVLLLAPSQHIRGFARFGTVTILLTVTVQRFEPMHKEQWAKITRIINAVVILVKCPVLNPE